MGEGGRRPGEGIRGTAGKEDAMVRRPVVAGTFYAGTKERLRLQVEDLLPREVKPGPALGVVVPHAGYLYSGRVAGAVYARVELPDTVVILGPNHTGLGAGAAIMTYGQWETPLGSVPIDAELGKAILANASVLEEDHLGHLREHSIEVQLPFLQYFERPFSFVPICLFSHEYAVCQNVGQAVAMAVRQAGKRVLLVASTDMSHYISRDEASPKDRKAIDAILALDPEGLHRVVQREGISMCGFHPTAAMLVAAKALGASRAELVMYTDSGEVTKSVDEVVAYAGLIIRC
jgi:AmmeMemoRadiSam system protein B